MRSKQSIAAAAAGATAVAKRPAAAVAHAAKLPRTKNKFAQLSEGDRKSAQNKLRQAAFEIVQKSNGIAAETSALDAIKIIADHIGMDGGALKTLALDHGVSPTLCHAKKIGKMQMRHERSADIWLLLDALDKQQVMLSGNRFPSGECDDGLRMLCILFVVGADVHTLKCLKGNLFNASVASLMENQLVEIA